MKNEVWKDIPGYEGLYLASSLGNIYSIKSKKILATSKNMTYYRVILTKNKQRKCCSVHRLVATTFLPNPYNLPQVHHIDGNHYNNTVSNLQWITKEDNQTEYFNSETFKQLVEKVRNQRYFLIKDDSLHFEYEMMKKEGISINLTTGEKVRTAKLLHDGYKIRCKYI